VKRLRQFVRLLLATQLLPVLESGEDAILVGGQAVLEGVMMRSPHAWAITVRKPNGEFARMAEPLERPSEKSPWKGWFGIRGLITLGQAMSLGVRALNFSANAALDESETVKAPAVSTTALNSLAPGTLAADAAPAGGVKKAIPAWAIALNVVISIAFFVFAYKFLPLFAATKIQAHYPALHGNFGLNLLDGMIRIVIFLLFLWGMSLTKDIRRVFQFHGAEHKTVFAFEDAADKSRRIEIAEAQRWPTFHPRCGTSFLMTIMLISMAIYIVVPTPTTFLARFGIRLALLPVIAGLSYELIRFAARHGKSMFALLTRPGLWLQRITTKPCDDTQVECAIDALDHAMSLEKQRGGELVIA
jgi:uncharacterized protein YqhQ